MVSAAVGEARLVASLVRPYYGLLWLTTACLEARLVHRLLEAHARLLEHGGLGAGLQRLLVGDARVVDARLGLVGRALLDESLGVHEVVLLVLDGGLQQLHLAQQVPQGTNGN